MGELTLVAGLGNPGPRYGGTRHNFGFLVVDALYEELSPSASWKEMFGGVVAKCQYGGGDLILMKPLTFMNLSGEPLSSVLKYFKVPVEALLVAHDEVDLPFGTLRLKRGGGEGGHNGLRSISSHLGTQEYDRLRLGVGKPQSLTLTGGGRSVEQGLGGASLKGSSSPGGRRVPDTAEWVLSRFSREEEARIPELVREAVKMIFCAIQEGVPAAQAKYHGAKAQPVK